MQARPLCARDSMPPNSQSSHVNVGLVLTQVRGEFLRVSTSDPEGAARAAKALRRGFELLNCCACCHRCLSCHDSVAGGHCQDCIENKEDQQLQASNASVGTALGVDGHGEERVDRAALREAFLESSYLPFASWLLREVGPTWLPIWDVVPAVSPDRVGTPGAATSPATAVSRGDGSDAAAVAAAAARVSLGQGDCSGADIGMPTPHPRSLFEAFFRPPAVPPSLALLALCDGLGRQAPEATNTRQLTSAYHFDGGGDGGGGEGALAVRATPAPDPRTVQHICRLLDPYLQEPSAQQQQQTALYMARPRLAESTDAGAVFNGGGDQSVRAAMGTLSIDGGGNGDGTPGVGAASPQSVSLVVSAESGQHQCGRASLLVRAVADMAGGVGSHEGGNGRARQEIDGAPCDVDPHHGSSSRPPLFAGGDAAAALASALCLAPQRVANSLGPIAPPGFAPAAFFPAVCGGVVHAILGIRSNCRAAAPMMPRAAADVWREFTGRLLTAGRAADLANAWLGAMLAGEPKDRRNAVDGDKTAAAAAPAAEAAGWEAWAEDYSSGIPEAHAWMMTRLPASRRKPFTEALLRALLPRDGRRHAGPGPGPGTWPPGFRTAACRILIGRPLLSIAERPPRQRHEDGEQPPVVGEEGGGRGAETLRGESESAAADDVSVGLVETLLLQRPLPPPAAEAIAETLAWCDGRRRGCAAGPAGAAARFGGVAGGKGGDRGGDGGGGGLLLGALKRVAAVWAEPSFLNRSPLRQQEFYTRFLLAALRSGGLDGQVGGADGDQEALILLIRGVGSHLDVPARETRLRGMRVGEAVAELGGQSLRFDELDGEREERRRRRQERDAAAAAKPDKGNGEGANSVEESGASTAAAAAAEGGADVSAGRRESRDDEEKHEKRRRRKGSKGRRKRDKGNSVRDDSGAEGGKQRRRQRLPAGWGGGDDNDSDLDPDMLLPLGGEESGSDTDAGIMVEAGDAHSNQEDRDSDSSSDGGSGSSSLGESWSGDEGHGNGDADLGDAAARGEFSLDVAEGAGDDDDDSLDAYDLWDDQEDLAKVSDPVYLDQLIELLRSRDKPDTADKHETALKCAEQLIRRNPPDLAHRAPELSRDLLYLENSFDLEGFEALRSGALVATTAAAPESCALYLGSELWGTGATEGTKLQVLDVLVQAASELAGWARPSTGGEHPSSSGGAYPSALMQEARGESPQGSARRQQHQQHQQKPGKQEPPSTRVAAAAATVASAGSTEIPERDGGAAVSSSRRVGGMPAGGTTRRWGYRRGPREQLRRNLFGRFAPVFFYPLAQGMVLRLRQSSTAPQPSSTRHQHPSEAGRTIAAAAAAAAPEVTPYTLPSAAPPPPPPSPLFAARLLHCLTCLVELCGSCPATPALAADLLGLAWLLRGAASESRELRRAVLIAVATGVERSQDGAASGAVQGQQGELLRWLQACAQGSDGATRELAGAVLGHSSVKALAYM